MKRISDNFLKKCLAVSLALLIAVSCSAAGFGTLTASAETLSGTVDTSSITYEYDTETKTLTLGGSGALSFVSMPVEVRGAETVIIGNGITSIAGDVFANVSNIKSFAVENGSDYFSCDENGVLFNKDKTNLVKYPLNNTATQYTIPETVTAIQDYAFNYSSNLLSVDFPSALVSIGAHSFSNCKGLIEINLPDTVETISQGCFMSCSNLQTVHLSDKITVIPSHAFDQCKKLTKINMPANLTTISDGAFFYCNLEAIEISDKVTVIDRPGFTFALSPAHIKVDENNPNFSSDENGVLYNKDKTLLLHCPNYETDFTYDITVKLGEFAFYGCQNLTSVTFSDNITEIPDYAFSRCDKLEIVIPDSISSIGYQAFYYCGSLKTITVPNSVTEIGDGAFYGCVNLTEAVLDCQISSLPSSLFYNNYKLTTVVLSETLTEINMNAFAYCDALKDVYFKGSKEQWNNIKIENVGNDALDAATIHYNYGKVGGVCGDDLTWSFDETTGELYVTGSGAMYSYDSFDYFEWSELKDSIKTVIIDGADNIGRNAFNGCENLSEVMLGESVTSVDENAFANCSNLAVVTVTYEGDVSVASTAFDGSNEKLTVIADSLNFSTAAYTQENSIVFIPVSYDSEKKILFFGNTMTVYDELDYLFLNYYISKYEESEYLHFDKLVFDGVLTDSYEAQEFENLDPDAEYLTFVDLYVSIKAVDRDGERSVTFGEMLEMYESGEYGAFILVTESEDGTSEQTLIRRIFERILLIASRVVNFFKNAFK